MSLQLRPYQRAAIDAIYDYFGRANGHPVVVIPTAGGKSLVMAEFIREVLEVWPDQRIVIITHVRELIGQNHAELLRLWPEAPAGIYSAGLKRREIDAQILFAGIQSIHRRAYDVQRADLILVDEAHLIPRRADTMYRRFLGDLATINPYLKVIGLTATPFRLDSGLLHEGAEALFTDLAYEVSVRELIDQGYLCPLISKQTETQLDVTGVGTRGGEFIASQLEAAVDQDPITRAAVDEIIAYGRDRKAWLLFCAGVGHARHVCDAVRARGISCATIFGETARQERDEIIGAFRRGEVRGGAAMVSDDLSFMARYGARLADNGYPVIPIMPGTKKPGGFRRSRWVDYPAWTRHCCRATTEHEIEIWSGWPDAAIGIACGTVIGIDIDIATDAEAALELERLAYARLGDTPALRIGCAPKRLLVYRAAAPFAGLKRAPLEVLGIGRQFVAYGLHPATGQPYVWPEESLVDLPLENLPTVDEAEVQAFIEEAYERVPEALRPKTLHDAARDLEAAFIVAQLDPLRALPIVRVPGNGREPDLNERQLDARRRAHEAMEALGGISSPAGSCVWHVVGLQRSVREWAMRQGWGGRPVRQEQAQGILVAALGVLAGHFGYENAA